MKPTLDLLDTLESNAQEFWQKPKLSNQEPDFELDRMLYLLDRDEQLSDRLPTVFWL
jgi:hypothetical protein